MKTASFTDSYEGSGIYHIGVQGTAGSAFTITERSDSFENAMEIILGPAGQWEIYSKDLTGLYLKIQLNQGHSQIGYIEQEE